MSTEERNCQAALAALNQASTMIQNGKSGPAKEQAVNDALDAARKLGGAAAEFASRLEAARRDRRS